MAALSFWLVRLRVANNDSGLLIRHGSLVSFSSTVVALASEVCPDDVCEWDSSGKFCPVAAACWFATGASILLLKEQPDEGATFAPPAVAPVETATVEKTTEKTNNDDSRATIVITTTTKTPDESKAVTKSEDVEQAS